MSGIPVGARPFPVTCPSCKASIVTTVESKTTIKTHLMAALLCSCLCGLLCTLVPESTTLVLHLIIKPSFEVSDSVLGFSKFFFILRFKRKHNGAQS
ncbi:hypothetical protein PYW08_015276 [Mythimna loreyi]|uniref:Uncharacterized protein n=1 Tax=Mythimna loreyi TaxID=667449 RepID=A0ACC2QV61_9NEOP|nr:hypothetical protein PYW08_015276 [Mythimna loreyi]